MIPTAPPSPLFPLSAIAHQPQLVLALSLLAVAPDIGGLLIRGDRGAAKSTAARGLAALLPGGGPFVNLPLGATEDRIIGSLDLDAALRGEARLRPGLLAEANGGLLYIDEVNLLPDHLVDLLLDSAAMGVVRVQRDSLSASLPARFALVGSMNPEEGQLRPQFLDRFGLCVDVLAPREADQRAEIVRRRMAYEANPAAFVAQWQSSEQALQSRLATARQRLATVTFPDELLQLLAALSTQAGVRSLRADLVLYRAARALSALEGRSAVSAQDIHTAAPLVLVHRRDPRQPPPPPQASDPNDNEPQPEQPDPNELTPSAAQSQPEEIFAPSATSQRLALSAQQRSGPLGQRPGALVRTVSDPQASAIHVPATVRAAATRTATSSQAPGHWQAQDLQRPIYANAGQQRVLFVADGSGSVGLAGRMGQVKSMMLQALEARTLVALIVFRGPGAELLLDWTNDTAAAETAIRMAPTGGRTPLAHALHLTAEMLTHHRAELVLFTDGRANVPLSPGSDAWADALSAAQQLRPQRAIVVDTEKGQVRLGRARALAQVLGGEVLTLEN